MNRKNALLGFIGAIVMYSTVCADSRHSILRPVFLDARYSRPILSSLSMTTDNPLGRASDSEDIFVEDSPKSPQKAFLFSALVPGTGELYAGAKRGYIFLGAEIAFWVGWTILNQKGGDLEDEFEQYADKHWDETRYRLWESYLDEEEFKRLTHGLPGTEEDPQAPSKKDQQYYEMIGKYNQFVLGWDDTQEEYEVSDYLTLASLSDVNSPNRVTYEDKRHESNKYLKGAGYMLGAILFNHVVSSIDAARCAKAQNPVWSQQPVRLEMAIVSDGDEVIPMLMASKRF